jgi:hypothetical protein
MIRPVTPQTQNHGAITQKHTCHLRQIHRSLAFLVLQKYSNCIFVLHIQRANSLNIKKQQFILLKYTSPFKMVSIEIPYSMTYSAIAQDVTIPCHLSL